MQYGDGAVEERVEAARGLVRALSDSDLDLDRHRDGEGRLRVGPSLFEAVPDAVLVHALHSHPGLEPAAVEAYERWLQGDPPAARTGVHNLFANAARTAAAEGQAITAAAADGGSEEIADDSEEGSGGVRAALTRRRLAVGIVALVALVGVAAGAAVLTGAVGAPLLGGPDGGATPTAGGTLTPTAGSESTATATAATATATAAPTPTTTETPTETVPGGSADGIDDDLKREYGLDPGRTYSPAFVDLFVAAGGSADVSRRVIVDTFFDNGTMTDRGSRAVQAIAGTTPEQHVKFVGIALSDRTLDDEDVRAFYTAAGLAKLETRGLDRLTSNGSASDLAISYADRLATYRMEHRVADNDTVTPWVQISERRLVRTHTDDGEIQLSELDAIRDGDNDGVLTFRERKAGTLPSVPDSDGDGLDDYDEIYGIPALGIGEGVLHPTQNDIVVEVDRAGLCTRLTSYEERQMKRAFRGGPSSPIFLHFAYDDYRLPKSESDTIGVEGADEFTNASQTFATVYDYVNRYEDRNPATHYALLTDANAISSEAVVGFHPTDPPDNNWFVVECNNLDIDRSGDQDEIEGVPFGRGPSFMHELGHSLGLPHPGTESNSADDMPPFDQHRSIMNYNAPETFYNFTDAEWEAISATLDRDES